MRPIHASLTVICAALALSGCETFGAREAVPAEVVAAAPAAPAHDYTQLMDDLRILSADDMQGRDTGSEGGAKARDYIISRLEALGVAPTPMGRLQPWERQGRSPDGPKLWQGTNILGIIQGIKVTDRYIVVTAHYDHVGTRDGHVYNGADDNASGVATMLELAKRLKAKPPEMSVIFVALDGEERGLLGAKHFVDAPPVPLSRIAMNLNFDMTGRADVDDKLWVTGTYQHPYFRAVLDQVAARTNVALAFGKDTPDDKGSDNWVNASDHAAFHAQNIPFLYLGVNFHDNYHKPSDDFETIQPAYFQQATELSIDSFYYLDRWFAQ